MPLHIDHILHIDDLPLDCIADCSGPGPADEPVEYWRSELEFTVDRESAINCLEGYGAWSHEELDESSDDDLATRILWLACGDFYEYQQEVKAGRADNPHCGSDIFVLE